MIDIDMMLAGLLVPITENATPPLIGLLAFTESLIVIGMFIPTIALMTAMGGLIAAGVLDPVPVLFWSVAGSALGDWVSYVLGRRIGPSIYRRWPLCNHRSAIARARLFFRRYGFASVFLGRFFGPVRATIPLVAGVMRMPERNFQMANVLSALVWVPVMLAPGYLGVASLPIEMLNGRQVIGIGAALLIGPLLLTGMAALFMLKRRGGKGGRRRLTYRRGIPD